MITKTWTQNKGTRLYRYVDTPSVTKMEGYDSIKRKAKVIHICLPETAEFSWSDWEKLFTYLREQIDQEFDKGEMQ